MLVQLFLFLSVAGATASEPAWAVPADWKLRPEAQVDSNGVFPDQIFSPKESNPSRSRPRLADAPGIGQALTLTRDQVLTLVRRQQPDFSGTLSGADRIRITRRTRTLAEPELLEMLCATLQRDHLRDRGELELRLTRPWVPTQVPDEPFVLKVLDLPSLGVTPSFIVRFELVGQRERFADCQAVVQARVWRDVLVARSTLKRGTILAAADVAPERRDILVLREPLDLAASTDTSLELVENVNPGSPLTARSVRARPLVTRGRLVDAVIQDGALNITLKVEVLEDGRAGQTVRVRNPVTRRELSGKVMNEQTVSVSL